MMNCKSCQAIMPDLLLESRLAGSAVREHLKTCSACEEQFAALIATFALLDTWEAPQLSPYFDQKMAVRLREEQAAPAAGLLEKLRSYLLLNTGRQFRPVLAGALALVLVVGGGSFGLSTFPHTQKSQASAAVNDLQIFDRNEQALQQMDQLMQDDSPADEGSAAQPRS